MARSKYGAVRTTVDGVTFASKREAARYGELKMLAKAGKISDLKLQPRYPLVLTREGATRGPVKVGDYVADFWYRDVRTGVGITEDVKGVKTPVYKLKKKLVEALYGIQITEVA